MTVNPPRKPGVGRIVWGALAIYPLSLAFMGMPWIIFLFGGGGWNAFLEQNGTVIVVFTIIGLAVFVAGVVAIVTGIRNRRRYARLMDSQQQPESTIPRA